MSVKKETVLLGMSGGIDSSMTAILLQEEGYDVSGITIRTWDSISESCLSKEKGCCTVESVFDAKKLADGLNIPHYIIDAREKFKSVVIADFIHEYLNGRTPNPCVVCNPHIKWEIMLAQADKLNCEYVATGHYAQALQNGHRFYISKGSDETKDQSYFLWDLPQEYLKRTLLPLGKMYKSDIRKMAKEKGYETLAKKRESQEICFIPENDYRHFLRNNIPDFTKKISQGNFIDSQGKILGTHNGYPFYTIGQRKGLDVAVGYPLYVKEIIPETNTVVLGTKDELGTKVMFISKFRLMKYETLPQNFEANIKIRFRNQGYKGKISIFEDKIKVEFQETVTAVTPGQSAVFYEGSDVVGGGIIENTF
ncbi:MAG: tRNA 2-thiouridine(34) synthase MnmA [Bacteroidia bacterium]|nr:tRNA 2-thiouridine(34) synthase MnmA [Bacteroidia bacterium]